MQPLAVLALVAFMVVLDFWDRIRICRVLNQTQRLLTRRAVSPAAGLSFGTLGGTVATTPKPVPFPPAHRVPFTHSVAWCPGHRPEDADYDAALLGECRG